MSELLVIDGHLSREQLDDLESYLESADRRLLQDEFELGDTLVLDEIFTPTESTEPLLEVPQTVAQTFRQTPPVKLARNTLPFGESSSAAAESPSELELEREQRYEFLDELGRGGMGQVVLAHDRILKRDIALKTLLPDTAEQGNPRDRLLQEAQVTGILEHPSIIPIYDLGALSNEEPYYTMRVVRERSLEQIIQEMAVGQEHAYSLTQLVSILRQVCLAVHYAHDRGVIHRDLKPENILIGAYGEVFVIDWGVAKVVNPDLGAVSQLGGDELGALVGTPQYMAPEQAQGENDAIDQRTDVYALGAILYEVLTLQPVFTAEHVLSLLFKAVQEEPAPPSARAPERSIPRELEDICLKALDKAPSNRYASAEAMADDLELFLEGVKERERRRQMAREAIERADEARAAYGRTHQKHAELMNELSHEKLNMTSWAPHHEKERVWALEQRVEDLQVEIERHFSEATRLYGQALGHLPEMSEARKALADLYWERFQEAEAAGERARATYFEGLVRQYNDGWYDQLLEGTARLTVLTHPEPAQAVLYEFVEVNRRLVERRMAELGETPVRNLELQHGSYVIELQRPGYVALQVPVRLDRMEERTLEIQLQRVDQVPDNFVVIAGGKFLSGELQAQNLEDHEQYLPDFGIMEAPVTCAEYLDFLNAVATDDLERAKKHAPRLEDGESYFPVSEDGQFSLPTEDAEGDRWDMNWPICMISYNDAVAYAAWRSKRDGFAYRLPSADEWEKAARGVDGRLYPWGNHFDPSFCRMRDSERGRPMPVSVHKYKMDRSPYGVRDMAGNVIEWTTTRAPSSDDRRIVQGASFGSIELMCRLDWHMDAQDDSRHAYLGFRLAMSL
ncbi:bifunctional serine/threonine-protein kinase/formylglycine-generating enzyme family protein [Persicimonas caeni]|uniref:bifunctional serine/threonine-protein kinase/formylglycine-generating enzyme family protein n=1 Tax=Persicimonas caeni TaxID=2292766 RepID=UPI00143E07A8|nr:bifunctional serine/threonine-protein kinase/formylglycine-generating enzyme family protein [Persicimonas caeni]